ncbi:MAG TPA: hypothetical protein VJ023_07985 [Pyrinomonadaceae bacterium]|nr:hypothetical protein [Pyrinomonadaceae bacterium]
MSDSTKAREEGVSAKRPKSLAGNERFKRPLVYAAILVFVFLLGFVPTCFVARQRRSERDTAQAALRISNLQNALGTAIVEVRSGNYEIARQGTSDFFTNLRIEIERDSNSIFNEAQQAKLRSFLEERDRTITLLARSDPYSADQLTKLYNQYREAVVTTSTP